MNEPFSPDHPAPDAPLLESGDWLDAGDRPLYLRRWQAPHHPEPLATVQIIHGMAEHSGRYRHVAAALSGQGWQVYAHDQRGHGRTAGETAQLGLFAERDGWRRTVADAQQVMDRACTESGGRPHVVIGHSMGSFVAQHLAIERGRDMAALVLSGTDTRPGLDTWLGARLAGLIARWRGPGHRSALLDRLTTGGFLRHIPDARTDRDWVSRDPDVVTACLADPFCGFKPTAALWRDILGGLHHISQPRQHRRLPKRLPVLMQVGSADPLSDGGRRVHQLARAYRAAGLREVEVLEYREARHEVYNELQRDQVIGDLIRWLATVVTTPAQ